MNNSSHHHNLSITQLINNTPYHHNLLTQPINNTPCQRTIVALGELLATSVAGASASGGGIGSIFGFGRR